MPTMIITKYSEVLSHYLLPPHRRCNSSIENVVAQGCHFNSGPASREQLCEEPEPLGFTLWLQPWGRRQLKTSRTPLILHSLICTVITMRTGWDNSWIIFLHKLVNKNKYSNIKNANSYKTLQIYRCSRGRSIRAKVYIKGFTGFSYKQNAYFQLQAIFKSSSNQDDANLTNPFFDYYLLTPRLNAGIQWAPFPNTL